MKTNFKPSNEFKMFFYTLGKTLRLILNPIILLIYLVTTFGTVSIIMILLYCKQL